MLTFTTVGAIEQTDDGHCLRITLPRLVVPISFLLGVLGLIAAMCGGLAWVMDTALARDADMPSWVHRWVPWVFAGAVYTKVLADAFVQVVGGRERIEVDGEFLTAVRPLCGANLKKRRRVRDIRQIRVSSSMPNRRQALFRAMLALAVRTGDGETMYVAAGQPIEVLGDVAEALGQAVDRWRGTAKDDGEAEAPVLVSGLSGLALIAPASVEELLRESVWEQPATSNVICERSRDALVFRVPAVKLNSSAHQLFYLGLALAIGPLTGVWIGVTGLMHRWHMLWVYFLGGCFLVIAVGIVLLLCGWQLIRRTPVFTARQESLTLQWRGPVRTSEVRWVRGSLQEIRAERSGVGRLENSLLVRTEEGGRRRIFRGRAIDELRWMAGRLREFYGMEEEES